MPGTGDDLEFLEHFVVDGERKILVDFHRNTSFKNIIDQVVLKVNRIICSEL